MIFRAVGSPKPVPPRLRGKKGVENVLPGRRVHAAAGVDQVQRHAVRRAVGPHDQLPAVGHRLLGVEHQIQHRAMKTLAIQQHGGQVGGQVIDHLDAGLLALGRKTPTPA